MWDLPGPGLEPVSHEIAGGFLTTAPPGKPLSDESLKMTESLGHNVGSEVTLKVNSHDLPRSVGVKWPRGTGPGRESYEDSLPCSA